MVMLYHVCVSLVLTFNKGLIITQYWHIIIVTISKMDCHSVPPEEDGNDGWGGGKSGVPMPSSR